MESPVTKHTVVKLVPNGANDCLVDKIPPLHLTLCLYDFISCPSHITYNIGGSNPCWYSVGYDVIALIVS